MAVTVEWLERVASLLRAELQDRDEVTVPELSEKLAASQRTTTETQARLIRAYTQQILNRVVCQFELGSGKRPGRFKRMAYSPKTPSPV